jgi:type VI secretion system protein ImpB
MSESTQHKLDRVRPPRVQITYDVEIGDAKQMKELPFVVGVLADLQGHQETPPAKLKERKFVEIDRDNFNDVLASLHPRLKVVVENKLQNNGTKLAAEINFSHMDDFHPAQIVNQVEPLKKLLEARQRLVDLLAKLDGNDELNALLQGAIADGSGLQELKTQLDDASK